VRIRQVRQRFLVRFEVGDVLPQTLVAVSQEQGWKSGSLSGIGGVQEVVLGYYDLAAREYVKIPVEGIVELVSLAGNLSSVDGAPFWHLHAAVAGRDGRLYGGHLINLRVAITLECWIDPTDLSVERKYEDACGLKLMNL
jgi:uncharacterized protein